MLREKDWRENSPVSFIRYTVNINKNRVIHLIFLLIYYCNSSFLRIKQIKFSRSIYNILRIFASTRVFHANKSSLCVCRIRLLKRAEFAMLFTRKIHGAFSFFSSLLLLFFYFSFGDGTSC